VLERIQTNRRLFILSMLAAWTAFGLFFGTQQYVRDVFVGKPASLPGYIISWLLCGYSWGILTVPVIRIARRLSPQSLGWPRFFLFHLPLAAAFSLLQLGIYVVIAKLLFVPADRSIWDFYQVIAVNEFQSSFLVYFVIVSAVAAYDKWLGVEEPAPISSAPQSYGNGNGFVRRFPVKENGRILLVGTENINWIESYGNYVFLHTDERRDILRETMAAMEKKLDPQQFVRIRRSAIIRADQIDEIHLGVNGEFEVVLKCGRTVAATRRYRKNLEAYIRS